MRCEITIRSALGILVHTTADDVSTMGALTRTLARADVQAKVGPLKHAELAVLCRPVTYSSAVAGKSDGSDKSDAVEGRAAA